jgi:hypothetical protein
MMRKSNNSSSSSGGGGDDNVDEDSKTTSGVKTPFGIAMDAHGHVWVADAHARRVCRLTFTNEESIVAEIVIVFHADSSNLPLLFLTRGQSFPAYIAVVPVAASDAADVAASTAADAAFVSTDVAPQCVFIGDACTNELYCLDSATGRVREVHTDTRKWLETSGENLAGFNALVYDDGRRTLYMAHQGKILTLQVAPENSVGTGNQRKAKSVGSSSSGGGSNTKEPSVICITPTLLVVFWRSNVPYRSQSCRTRRWPRFRPRYFT